jgi:TetR/AcrR family transcriptional repressor of nem operon
MARPKEFRREVVLDKAMELFWTHGYEATSMSDLQRCMGIGRQSLYDTFGGKKEVFQESLERYLEGVKRYSESLLGAADGLVAIRTYFDTAIRNQTRATPRRACMMFNTCAEVAPHDPEIRKQVRKGVSALQKRFELALRRAQEQGALSTNADAHALAIFLTTQAGGITIMSRGGASRKELQSTVDVALRAIS